MAKCAQPGCGGTIEDGYCDTCGMAPAQGAAPQAATAGAAAGAAAPSQRTAPRTASTRTGSGPTGRTGSTRSGRTRSTRSGSTRTGHSATRAMGSRPLLLSGPSIHLRTRVAPLAERNLLDQASREVSVVPEELVVTMAQAFERARDAVLAVAKAWKELTPAVEHMEAQIAQLRRAAQELDEQAARAELGPIESEVDALRARIATDPLGVTGDVERSIRPRVAAVRQRVEVLAAARDRASASLARAGALRQELDRAHRAALDAVAQAERQFTPAPSFGAILEEESIAGVDAWRAKLEQTMAADHFGPAEVGAARLVETLEGYVAGERAVREPYDALVARREELSGRLSARRAQADALAARGARVEPAAADHAGRADELLRARPTPLADAAAEVDAFERGVRDATARTPRGV